MGTPDTIISSRRRLKVLVSRTDWETNLPAVVGRHSREVLFFRPENQLFSTRPERKDLTIYQEMDGAILL